MGLWGSFRIPNGREVRMLVDTSSAYSFLDSSVQEQLSVDIKPLESPYTFGYGGSARAVATAWWFSGT